MKQWMIEGKSNKNGSNSCNEIETVHQLQAICRSQHPLLLVHQITANDLCLAFKQNTPFTIAWYGVPFTPNLNSTNNTQYIRCLLSNQRLLSPQPLSQQIQRYPDLKQKMQQMRNTQIIQS